MARDVEDAYPEIEAEADDKSRPSRGERETDEPRHREEQGKRRNKNSMTLNEVAVQLWAVAARIPCELCGIKGGSNILPDGGCRHRSSKEALMTALEAVLRISRALKLPIVVGRGSDPIH